MGGFPTLKAIIRGKGKAYNGARETEAMKQFITNVKAKQGSKGGSSKCPKGIFKSGVKDSVIPLCKDHFPNDKAKNSWVIAFYPDGFEKEVFNRFALDLGNEPADKSKQLKKQMKQRDRLKNLQE